MKDFISAIEKQLKQEQEELDSAEDITEIVFPVIDNLKKKDIVHSMLLKAKLMKLPDEYRDATYGLCRIATDAGPEGSVVVLDPKKVLSIIDEIELDEQSQSTDKKDKKFILGFSRKVANAIKGLVYGKLSTLCHLVNDLVLRKIINTPSIDKLKTVSIKISKLKSTKTKGAGRS